MRPVELTRLPTTIAVFIGFALLGTVLLAAGDAMVGAATVSLGLWGLSVFLGLDERSPLGWTGRVVALVGSSVSVGIVCVVFLIAADDVAASGQVALRDSPTTVRVVASSD